VALLFVDKFEYDVGDIAAKWFTVMAEKANIASEGIQGVAMALKGVGTAVKGVDYGKHLTAKPVVAHVSTSKAVKGAEVASSVEESKTLHKGVFTDGTLITVEGSRTLNLGNYESARVGVTLTVPCTKDTVDDAYEYATNWITGKIEEAVALAKQ
jgi:hypothetical protein